MRRTLFTYLTLLLCLLVSVARAADTERDEKKITLVLTLVASNERIAGTIDSWDFQALTIIPTTPKDAVTSRTLEWCDVRGESALTALQRLIDRKNARQWLCAGLALLHCGNEREADRAFANASRIDRELLKVIDSARAYREQGRDVWEALPPEPQEAPKDDPKSTPPATQTPGRPPPDRDGAEKGASAWPTATPEERIEHIAQVKKNADEMIAKANVRLKQTESPHFIIYSDLPPADVKARTSELENMNSVLLETFNLPKDSNVFHGKCAVFIFEHREDFLTFETAAFGFNATRAGGVCHPRGPFTYCSFFRGNAGSNYYRSTLVHETVHAFMYRYKSPAELPTWTNEGLADAIAAEIVTDDGQGLSAWNHARQFATQNKRAMDVMNQSYLDGTWFNQDSYPISHMLVRLMIRADPGGFKKWINDIKDGVDWRQSLNERMGTTPESLSDRFNIAIRAEKRYMRIRE